MISDLVLYVKDSRATLPHNLILIAKVASRSSLSLGCRSGLFMSRLVASSALLVSPTWQFCERLKSFNSILLYNAHRGAQGREILTCERAEQFALARLSPCFFPCSLFLGHSHVYSSTLLVST